MNVDSIAGMMSAAYNADGLRAWKTAGGAATFFLYDGDTPLEEQDANGNVLAAYLFGADGLRQRYLVAKNGASEYFYDPQGSVVNRWSEFDFYPYNPSVLDTAEYDGYGVLRGELDANGDPEQNPGPIGFGGQYGYYTDQETGLVLMTNRYYDPGTGRFLTRDPIGYGGGINLYGFVGNNPVTGADPEGTDGIRARLAGLWHGFSDFVYYNFPIIGPLNRMHDRAPGIRDNLVAVTKSGGANTRAQGGSVRGLLGMDLDVVNAAQDVYSAGGASVAETASSSWLSHHEGSYPLGHTIARHVPKDDAFLVARLAAGGVKAASSFTDAATAEWAIGTAIKEARPSIRAWLGSGARVGNLVLNFKSNVVVGRGIAFGESAVSNRTNARIVLRALGGGRYVILTAFPE